ncbi:MAG: hypothetical protein R6U38_09865 [Desulfatiglandaceae bacterium]
MVAEKPENGRHWGRPLHIYFSESDELILGDEDFVADAPAEAEEVMERKAAPAVQGVSLCRVIDLVADLMSMPR